MYLIYLDESGNTGNDLKDVQQPIFVLGALIVPETAWQALEARIVQLVSDSFPDKPEDVEIHATDIRSGRGYFRGIALSIRMEFLQRCLLLVEEYGLKVVFRSIEKHRFSSWVDHSFPKGVNINPHVVAFPLVARVLDDYLQAQSPEALGMLISDENTEIVGDIEKTTSFLRLTDGVLRLHRIIEQCFFVDSKTSLILQLCDICTFYCRKMAEFDCAVRVRDHDIDNIAIIRRLQHEGSEAFEDTIEWIVAERQKKRAARG